MVTRSKCLYGDEIIGIESIYTLIDGKQINKVNEVERIRELGRKNQLFCPCGCGANLILVAGEKNLVRQHFRTRSDHEENGAHACTWKEESDLSIQSKITLKCWLENKMDMGNEGIKYSLRASEIIKSGRKFELSFYSSKNHFGLVYVKDKKGIYDEKLTYLNEFLNTKILYITDIKNHNESGQYPEFMKKMQKQQGFCAFLSFENESEYKDAYLRTSFYRMNSRGLWINHDLSFDKLDAYSFDENSDICLNGKPLIHLVKEYTQRLEEREAAILLKEKDISKPKEQNNEFRKNELIHSLVSPNTTSNIPVKTNIPVYINQESCLETNSNLREITPKTMFVYKNICEKGRNLEGMFLYKEQNMDESILKRSRFKVHIDHIEIKPSQIILYDDKQKKYFYIFINEHINEGELLMNDGTPYCNISLKYTEPEDSWRVINQQFIIK